MGDIAINCEGLSKRYRIGQRESYRALRDTLTDLMYSPFRRLGSAFRPAKNTGDNMGGTIWALHDVSFDVKRGEVMGVVGRNGAGKSTLLKIFSRITHPTRGFARINGRVGSLLEVGTGFHPELTGRENIFLNGAILGMKRAEVTRNFDEIVAFAEVDKFIDTPVKRYSSGMYMRLAFAVAAHLNPEILVIDEVLSVGDSHFQKKCLGKMDDVARSGRTVLFVSHNMAAVQRLCNRGVFLDGGRVVDVGPIDKIVSRYNEIGQSEEVARFDPRKRSGLGWARVEDVRIVNEQNVSVSACPTDANLIFEVDLALNRSSSVGASLRGLVLELILCTEQGQPLISLMNVDDNGVDLPEMKTCRVQMQLPGPTFVPGRYRLNIFLGVPNLQHVDEIPDALSFEILPPLQPWRPFELTQNRGMLCRKADWKLVDQGTTLTTHPTILQPA
jgi:lipopolysaccharide transport system ATP-binding protein